MLLLAYVGCAHAQSSDFIGVATDESKGTRELWALHGQATFVEQYHPAFHSLSRGENLLDPGSRGDETLGLTLFAGARLWDGGELYIDPEVNQGFGLSDTHGVAGFPNGEAKAGSARPYVRLQALFVRQTFDLGGEHQDVGSGANQLAGTTTTDRLVLTAGKFSVTDVFDTNTYAHDSKKDFLNWAVNDSGAFDYAQDAWGYSYGVAAEWTEAWWTVRAGFFDLTRMPGTTELVRGFGQYEFVLEAEERHALLGLEGRIKLLGFVNRGRMGSYNDAVALSGLTGTTPNTASVRHPAARPGAAINLEQALTDEVGLFLRASLNDGSKETFEFTEINRSLAAGFSLKGTGWARVGDTIGFAFVSNEISSSARRYLAAGGNGILIGDGSLERYGREVIAEIYYSAKVTDQLTASADYQWINNPAYNRDRGPVSVLGVRLHVDY
jgi:high affinity Mn2+ porin